MPDHRTSAASKSDASAGHDTASACDLLGKRWTLKVVRELARGPQRFTDLHRRLVGISTSVLAARLRDLEQSDVAGRRRLPPPAGSAVYELTERGRALGRIVLALEEWDTRTLTAVAREPVRHGRREAKQKRVRAR
jgi:DNA-binding HxlR family transcriptional regulator